MSVLRFDLLGLEAYLAIAERGSFNKAAQSVGITQAALSHRLRKFEEQIGTRLIHRTTRHVSLTPAGLDLLPKARHLLDTTSNLLNDLRLESFDRRERIAFGCLPTMAMHVLPEVMQEFHQRHPQVAVRVFDNAAGEIANIVEKGEAEFGITIQGADRWNLDAEPLAKEPYVLLCRKDAQVAKKGAVTWRQLSGEPLIRVSTQTGNRLLIDAALGNRKERMSWTHEVQHVASAVALVEAGVGMAVVPRIALGPHTRGIKAVALRGPSINRTLVLVKRKGLPLSVKAQELREIIATRLSRALKGRSD